mmetsp:Transcript_83290/g.97345  ORF Transcript_83290/g.97345 Transcript_83290/m.97345 type:complete len:222 (+) Transcript_83290:102-767(+)
MRAPPRTRPPPPPPPKRTVLLIPRSSSNPRRHQEGKPRRIHTELAAVGRRLLLLLPAAAEAEEVAGDLRRCFLHHPTKLPRRRGLSCTRVMQLRTYQIYSTHTHTHTPITMVHHKKLLVRVVRSAGKKKKCNGGERQRDHRMKNSEDAIFVHFRGWLCPSLLLVLKEKKKEESERVLFRLFTVAYHFNFSLRVGDVCVGKAEKICNRIPLCGLQWDGRMHP